MGSGSTEKIPRTRFSKTAEEGEQRKRGPKTRPMIRGKTSSIGQRGRPGNGKFQREPVHSKTSQDMAQEKKSERGEIGLGREQQQRRTVGKRSLGKSAGKKSGVRRGNWGVRE